MKLAREERFEVDIATICMYNRRPSASSSSTYATSRPALSNFLPVSALSTPPHLSSLWDEDCRRAGLSKERDSKPLNAEMYCIVPLLWMLLELRATDKSQK